MEANEKAVGDILKYGMSYKRSSLFMIKKKYLDLDLSDITQMKGYNILDLALIGDLNVRRVTQVVANQAIGGEIR